ncbi:MAG: hypothetical protein WBL44_18240 [Nitrososphaeraceae archaeon]|jgi:hypothetical protein
MTISNKYNAGFCVLTIKVVGYAHVIWIADKMVENAFSINFWKSMVAKSGFTYVRDGVSSFHALAKEHDQGRRFESGVANQV